MKDLCEETKANAREKTALAASATAAAGAAAEMMQFINAILVDAV